MEGGRSGATSIAQHVAPLFDPSADWALVADVRKGWDGPFVVKGIPSTPATRGPPWRMTLSVPHQIDNADREHEEIFVAVRDCNPDRAERAMRGHLARGHEVYWSPMGTGGGAKEGDGGPCPGGGRT